MRKLKIKSLKDPVYFLEKILGLNLAPFHKQWIRLVERNDRIVIEAPRGHGKTEVIIIGYMIYKAYTQANFEGLIISKSMPQSTDVLRRIKTHIRGSDILAPSIPIGKETPWSRTELELTNGARIMCKPYSDAVRGFHVNIVACDEIGTYDEKETFWYAVSPTVNKKRGKILCIGTPQSKLDLLHDLARNKAWTHKRYQAIQNGKSLWPQSFPLNVLNRIKEEQGKLGFSREYMCEPLSSENQLFPYHLISRNFLPKKRFLFEARENPNNTYFIGADFAMSGASGADYTVFVVLEKDEDGFVTIVRIERYKSTPYEAQKAFLKDLNTRFRPIKILLDESTFGQTFLQQLREERLNVEGFKFTNESKFDLITHLVNQFERGNIKIPKNDEDLNTKELVEILTKELMSFGAEPTASGRGIAFRGIDAHDDTVIALALAVYSATKYPVGMTARIARTNYSRRH